MVALRAPLTILVQHKAPALGVDIGPFGGAIRRDPQQDIIAVRMLFPDHRAAIGKLDDACPFGSLGVFDHQPAAGKCVTVREGEAHSTEPRDHVLRRQYIAPRLESSRDFGKFQR